MAKLIFEYTDKKFIKHNREIKKVELEIPDDMDITEFKIACKRLALSIGYQQSTVDNSFGLIKQKMDFTTLY